MIIFKNSNALILYFRYLILFFLLIFSVNLLAQQAVVLSAPDNSNDTIRVIEIIRAERLREKQIDSSVSLQIIAGDVQLQEGLTKFNCDSATINKATNVVEAFGNVHINQHDSIHTYSQYLKYVGKDRIAFLKKNVKLSDGKGVLFTQELEFDMNTNIGRFKNGGKVVNGSTVLTSDDGTYFADTRDVFFKHHVHLKDPKYDIVTDSLRYNTALQQAEFIADTHIKTNDGAEIFTQSGNYDLKNGKAYFGSRTIFKDSTRTYVSDNSAYDELSGTAQLEGNAVIKDSVNGYTILGNQIFLNKKNNSFLATRKPVLIFKGEGEDSTYVAADTLYSGIKVMGEENSLVTYITDTVKEVTVFAEDKIVPNDSTRPKALQSMPDKKSGTLKDSTTRFFQAFHHVRIFNDSLQAVCDSLYYSFSDSVFRMFQEPVIFSRESEIIGDTMYLFTKNKKPQRAYVFERGIIVNKLNEKMYNQIGGKTLNCYFKENEIDYIRVKGLPSESIFYPQDEDSAFTGMNRSSCDVIDIYFSEQTIQKVKYINEVNGILYPMNQIPSDQKLLKGFLWLDQRRPKTKIEIFE